MQLKYISEGTLMWPLWGLKTLWLIFMKVSINLCNFEIAFMHILITSISIVDTGMVLWSIKHSIIDMTSSDTIYWWSGCILTVLFVTVCLQWLPDEGDYIFLEWFVWVEGMRHKWWEGAASWGPGGEKHQSQDSGQTCNRCLTTFGTESKLLGDRSDIHL